MDSFNFFIRVAVKLSVIEMFFPFCFFFQLRMFLPSLYLTNLTMVGLDFQPTSLGFPIICASSILTLVITNSRCSFIVARHRLSFFSFLFSGMPCNNKRLHHEYCSCLSTRLDRLPTSLDMLVKHSSGALILPFFLPYLSHNIQTCLK